MGGLNLLGLGNRDHDLNFGIKPEDHVQHGAFCVLVVVDWAKINPAGLQGKGCRAQEGQQAE